MLASTSGSVAETPANAVPAGSHWLDRVRSDYRVLDRADFASFKGVRVMSSGPIAAKLMDGITAEQVRPGVLIRALRRLPVVPDLLLAMKVLAKAGAKTAIIADGGDKASKLTCLLNSVLPLRRRKILMWESHIQAEWPGKKKLVRRMLSGCDVVVVYSRQLVQLQSEYLDLPPEKFVFLPYKANHSKQPPIAARLGDYIFSGGNSQRDYATLCDAVRGTGIPVIISTTAPETRRGLDVPPNVILVAAQEPHFARLMAGSRFVVLAIKPGIVVGAANASICNAMWHSRAVIAADDVSLSDYVEDGVNGYAVAARDVENLRRRIVELWNDPAKAEAMGREGFARVSQDKTHAHMMRRLLRTAGLLAANGAESGTPHAR